LRKVNRWRILRIDAYLRKRVSSRARELTEKGRPATAGRRTTDWNVTAPLITSVVG